MFSITCYQANGANWDEQSIDRARYYEIGEIDYPGNLDERTLSLIADHRPPKSRSARIACGTWLQ